MIPNFAGSYTSHSDPPNSPVPAGVGKRLAAWLIDTVICIFPAAIAYCVSVYVLLKSSLFFLGASPIEILMRGSEFVVKYPRQYLEVWLITLAVLLVVALTLNVLGGRSGQTPGRKAVAIHLRDEQTGKPLGAGFALLRAAFFHLVPFVALISIILILVDSTRRRGLHDRVVGAAVQSGAAQQVRERLASATAVPGTPLHDTQVFQSPLVRGLNAPTRPSSPPVPLPTWLDRASASRPQPALHAPVPPPPQQEAPSQIVPPPPEPRVEAIAAEPSVSKLENDLDSEVEMTRLVAPGQARREYRPGAPEPVARIQVSDGQLADIRGTTLVGRNPEPRAQEHALTLLSVQDPNRSVSKTHLILDLDARGLWLADRTSTNGTVVTLADGQKIVCMPERQVRVTAGAKIQIGDVTITVLPV